MNIKKQEYLNEAYAKYLKVVAFYEEHKAVLGNSIDPRAIAILDKAKIEFENQKEFLKSSSIIDDLPSKSQTAQKDYEETPLCQSDIDALDTELQNQYVKALYPSAALDANIQQQLQINNLPSLLSLSSLGTGIVDYEVV